ncbi:MAG: calcium/sodium antiporter [Bacteroidota bacterium]
MELLSYILLFIISLGVLLKASDWLVGAAERIGLSFGISPFIIGVTIVSFGTSLPELSSSIVAVLSGSSEIVLGNVVGSNITNILLVLALTAIVGKQIFLSYDVMKLDMPLLVGTSFMLMFMLYDKELSKFEACILLGSLVVFLLNSFDSMEESEDEDRPKVGPRDYVLLGLSAVLVYFGATYTILSIEELSSQAGINKEIIALTAVAIGTSLPEVIVSVTAARKGKTEIAVGNVLGSNIFNTLAVMGIPALIGNLKVPESILDFSLPFMVAMSIMFALVCMSKKITRLEGMMLLLFYAFFLSFIFKSI